jgi:hypothetical protein
MRARREKKRSIFLVSRRKKTEYRTDYSRRVRADARCVDETTIGMLFIRSGHDWMMKRCGRRRRKMVDDRSFFSSFFFCSVCLADADGPIFLTSLSLTLDGNDMQASRAMDMISSYSFAMQTEDI